MSSKEEELQHSPSGSSPDLKRRRTGEKDEENEAKTSTKCRSGDNTGGNEKTNAVGKDDDGEERLCPVCEMHTDDWLDDPAVCKTCKENFGCGDCCWESGGFCETCKVYKCNDCPNPVRECDRCEKRHCVECGNFRKKKSPPDDPSAEEEEEEVICAACAKNDGNTMCAVCDEEVANSAIARCSRCGTNEGTCYDCAIEDEDDEDGGNMNMCSVCDEFFCGECCILCHECEKNFCKDCGDSKVVGGVNVCGECRPGGTTLGSNLCSGCGEKITRSERCMDCGALKCFCGGNCECRSSSQDEDDEDDDDSLGEEEGSSADEGAPPNVGKKDQGDDESDEDGDVEDSELDDDDDDDIDADEDDDDDEDDDSEAEDNDEEEE